ncbi:MAG TPA: zinc-ribbon domain containing protein [Usitatibacter sp.]|nr:zinc-ribbon domain containing protein [Usitatibacter sp.]HST00614.1 zinc-ribbon domain containing protein [Usitatibacter sp.]
MSGRLRRVQIKQRRAGKKAASEAAAARAEALRAAKARAELLRGKILVNPHNLRPTNSYGTPDFEQRGFYVDMPFKCKDCGISQIWTATQQKWWYESAKGDVWTVAVRCRPCRRRERERKSVARMVQSEGLAKKRPARQ